MQIDGRRSMSRRRCRVPPRSRSTWDKPPRACTTAGISVEWHFGSIFGQFPKKKKLLSYRVTLVVEYLGWVGLDLGSSPGPAGGLLL